MGRIAIAATAAAALVATGAIAQAPDTVPSSSLQWRTIVPGADFAAAYGDWEKDPHGKFVRFVPGTKVPMHTHTGAYHGVMISGRMANLYAGDVRVEVEPGTYFHVSAMRPHGHECVSAEPCLFYTHSDALWDLQLIEE